MEQNKSPLFGEVLKTREVLFKEGTIVINSNFDEVVMENVFFKIRELIRDNNVPEIFIYINSNGGDVTSLFPLIDIINYSPKSISTIILGKAYSAGAILALCGHNGKRFAHRNSDILLHEVASSSSGESVKNTQIQLNAERAKYLNNKLVSIIKENTKLSKKQIKEYMESNLDKFITAEKAIKYGIIDKII